MPLAYSLVRIVSEKTTVERCLSNARNALEKFQLVLYTKARNLQPDKKQKPIILQHSTAQHSTEKTGSRLALHDRSSFDDLLGGLAGVLLEVLVEQLAQLGHLFSEVGRASP